MTGNDYNIALMIFFPSYIVFEVPSNILIKRLAPSTWLSLIMFLWGVITICEGLVQTKTQLYTLTILLVFYSPRLHVPYVRQSTLAGIVLNIALQSSACTTSATRTSGASTFSSRALFLPVHFQDCWHTPLRTWTEWRDTQAGDG